MNYQDKYLKYKKKYLNLIGGTQDQDQDKDKDNTYHYRPYPQTNNTRHRYQYNNHPHQNDLYYPQTNNTRHRYQYNNHPHQNDLYYPQTNNTRHRYQYNNPPHQNDPYHSYRQNNLYYHQNDPYHSYRQNNPPPPQQIRHREQQIRNPNQQIRNHNQQIRNPNQQTNIHNTPTSESVYIYDISKKKYTCPEINNMNDEDFLKIIKDFTSYSMNYNLGYIKEEFNKIHNRKLDNKITGDVKIHKDNTCKKYRKINNIIYDKNFYEKYRRNSTNKPESARKFEKYVSNFLENIDFEEIAGKYKGTYINQFFISNSKINIVSQGIISGRGSINKLNERIANNKKDLNNHVRLFDNFIIYLNNFEKRDDNTNDVYREQFYFIHDNIMKIIKKNVNDTITSKLQLLYYIIDFIKSANLPSNLNNKYGYDYEFEKGKKLNYNNILRRIELFESSFNRVYDESNKLRESYKETMSSLRKDYIEYCEIFNKLEFRLGNLILNLNYCIKYRIIDVIEFEGDNNSLDKKKSFKNHLLEIKFELNNYITLVNKIKDKIIFYREKMIEKINEDYNNVENYIKKLKSDKRIKDNEIEKNIENSKLKIKSLKNKNKNINGLYINIINKSSEINQIIENIEREINILTQEIKNKDATTSINYENIHPIFRNLKKYILNNEYINDINILCNALINESEYNNNNELKFLRELCQLFMF